MMAGYRISPPKSINGSKVIKIADYKTQELQDISGGTKSKIDLPKSDVLQFFTEDGSKISIRPSGTEPKIKFYFGVKDKFERAEDFDKANALLGKKVEDIKKDLKLL